MTPTRTLASLALLLALVACDRSESPAANVTAPNAPVIIISIDTLRADHLPAYGYDGVETPAIDALRKDSLLYLDAWSHVPLTLPSHTSLLTGLIPPDHGVRNNIGFSFDAAKHPTLPSLLKQRGYATGAAVSAYVLRGSTGFGSLFDFYDDRISVRAGQAVGRVQRPGSETVAAAKQWIEGQGDKPFFFMLHLFEPHTPYAAPEPFKSKYASVPYDGEIAASDALVGEFIAALKAKGIYDRAVIVLLSDHGEGLGDHGEDEHGIFLYREDLHVPLMVKLPKSQRAGESIDAPVQLIDVFPTITALAGIDNPPGLRGQSLLATIPPSRKIYSETLYPRIHLGWSDLRSIVDADFHYIDAPRPELYAMSDVAEKSNVLADNRRVVAAMRKELEPISREMPTVGTIDPEEAKKLAALGYLSSSSSASSGPLPDPKDQIGVLELLRQGGREESAGRTLEAIRIYREVIAKNPRLTDAWTLLARQLERSGRLEEAIETYKRAVELAPSSAGEHMLSIANLYLMLNRPNEAAEHAELGMSMNPGNAHLILGRVAMFRNDVAATEREARAAMETFNYRVPGIVLLAQLRVKQGNLKEAGALVDQALDEVKTKNLDVPPLLFFVRGDILARMNMMDVAIQAFNEEISRFPDNRQSYANLAVIYTLSGRRTEANQTMERLVSANPSPAAYQLAVATFTEIGDTESAAAWRRRAAAFR